MHFNYRGMDIFHDWLEITYRISNTTFDINCAKEICSAFAEGEAVLSCITTSYEEDLSDTSSFFDSYTRHCSIRNIEDLKNEPLTIEKKPMIEGRNVTMYLAPQA